MPEIPLDDSLKLAQCPRCDYSLQGSPEIGICPECGDAYNNDFIVLRGRPVTLGDEPNGQRGVSYPGIALNLLAEIALAFFLLHMMAPWPLAILLLPGLSILLCDLLIATAPVRRNEVLVWVSPAGIGQQSFLERDSLSGKTVQNIATLRRVLKWPLFLSIWFMIPKIAMHDFNQLFLPLLIFTLICLIAYILDRGRRPTYALRALGIRPALLPWRTLGGVVLEDLGGGSFQLWTKKSDRIRPLDITNIELRLSQPGAMQLLHLIEGWAAPETPVTHKPLDRSPGPRAARKAGLFLGRIFRGR